MTATVMYFAIKWVPMSSWLNPAVAQLQCQVKQQFLNSNFHQKEEALMMTCHNCQCGINNCADNKNAKQTAKTI